MQVAAVGSLSDACTSSVLPAICIERPGSRNLKPRRGALLHAVMNFNKEDCCPGVKLATTCREAKVGGVHEVERGCSGMH